MFRSAQFSGQDIGNDPSIPAYAPLVWSRSETALACAIGPVLYTLIPLDPMDSYWIPRFPVFIPPRPGTFLSL
jgi:hypothetical protein